MNAPQATSSLNRLGLNQVGVVAIVLVVAGLVLGATVDMAFWILFAAGAFGPPLLREMGILKDQDELQREISLRAGRRAYIAGGLFLLTVIISKSWGQANLDHTEFSAAASLMSMLVTYFLSYVTEFWGPRLAARRILMAFGAVWLTFVVISHGGEAVHESPMALLAELSVVIPFFALAFACRRWPLVSGVLLALVGAGLFVVAKGWRALAGDAGGIIVLLTFILPLVYTGIALIGASRLPDEAAA